MTTMEALVCRNELAGAIAADEEPPELEQPVTDQVNTTIMKKKMRFIAER